MISIMTDKSVSGLNSNNVLRKQDAFFRFYTFTRSQHSVKNISNHSALRTNQAMPGKSKKAAETPADGCLQAYNDQVKAILSHESSVAYDRVLISFARQNCPQLPLPTPNWQRTLAQQHVDFLADEFCKDLRQWVQHYHSRERDNVDAALC